MRSKMIRITRRRAIVGLLSLALLLVLIAAACGEDEVPTLIPAPTAVPATSVPDAPAPTAMPAEPTEVPVAQIRTEDEWTAENPATLEEIEEIVQDSGQKIAETNTTEAKGAYPRECDFRPNAYLDAGFQRLELVAPRLPRSWLTDDD